MTPKLETQDEKATVKTDWFKYINSILIAFILGFAIMIWSGIRNVQSTQIEQGKELIRIKTIQDANTLSISILNTRVSALELNQAETIKIWVELNFIRKTQK